MSISKSNNSAQENAINTMQKEKIDKAAAGMTHILFKQLIESSMNSEEKFEESDKINSEITNFLLAEILAHQAAKSSDITEHLKSQIQNYK